MRSTVTSISDAEGAGSGSGAKGEGNGARFFHFCSTLPDYVARSPVEQ